MRTIAWGVFAALLVAVIAVTLWDEPLDPRVQDWLTNDQPTVLAGDNGYFALMGLFAAISDDPHAVGRNRVRSYELALSSTSDASELDYKDYPISSRLRTGNEFDFLCQVEKSSCIARFLEHADSIVALSEKHHVLFERYQSLFDFPDFRSTATLGLREPLIPLGLLASLNRLQLAWLTVEFHGGSRLKVIDQLGRDMRFLRRLIRSTDQFVVKVLAVEMLARDLHTLSQLLDSKLYLHQHLPALDDVLVDLSAGERAVDICIRREFEAMANLMLTMDSIRPFDTDTELPRWMMKTLYKPNATVNRISRTYLRTRDLGELPPADLARTLQQPNLNADPSPIEYVLNPIGTILSQVADPELNRYLLVVSDASGLLRLVRLKRMIRARGLGVEQIEMFLAEQGENLGSPYTSAPMRWDPERQVIFYQGLSDRRHLQEIGLFLVEPQRLTGM